MQTQVWGPFPSLFEDIVGIQGEISDQDSPQPAITTKLIIYRN